MMQIKCILGCLLLGLVSESAFSTTSQNPYINKNITTHFQEFVTFEILSEFHKAIDSYNQTRADLPEIKFKIDHYEMMDKNNKVEFSIGLALNGNFFYNGQSLNIKNLTELSQNKTVFSFIINNVSAAEVVVSNILTAALWKIIPLFDRAQAFTGLSQMRVFKTSIAVYQKACDDLATHGGYEGYISKMNKEKKILDELFRYMSENKNNEAAIVKDALGINDPNCARVGGSHHEVLQYGSGFSDGLANANGSRTNENICVALEKLKECLLNIDPININATDRKYLKEKEGTAVDDLKAYNPSSSADK
jgi:hypothetical protein